ncbi:MAG: YbaB/EbfC family nucleoid-associated protein [Eggerthellaceae bacterium]|jgi:DNA-binding YbaB/EbfC family protein
MGMDMRQMMRQAQKMQRELATAQDEIKDMTYTATSGGGVVTAVARGDGRIESLTIKPEVVDPEDVSLLEDMVTAAVNEALKGVSEQADKRLSSVTGGMNIPGMPGLM